MKGYFTEIGNINALQDRVPCAILTEFSVFVGSPMGDCKFRGIRIKDSDDYEGLTSGVRFPQLFSAPERQKS